MIRDRLPEVATSLAALKSALESGDAPALLAALSRLDDTDKQAILGRARTSAYGLGATAPELSPYADDAALLLTLLLPTHPKAFALRGELTRLRLSRRSGAALPLPASAFTGWPALERLDLERVAFDAPLDLRGLARLTHVSLESVTLGGGVQLPVTASYVSLQAVLGVSSLAAIGGAGVQTIWASNLTELTTLGALDGWPSLTKLHVRGAPALAAFGSGVAPALRSVMLERCPLLTSLDGFPNSPWLREVSLSELPVTSLRGLPPGLTELKVFGCPLVTLEGLPNLPLTSWRYVGKELVSLAGIQALSSLVELELHTPALRDLSALAALPGLARLTLTNVGLRDLSVLRGCVALEHLTLQKMDVDPATLPSTLRSLDLRGCAAISDVSGLTRQADLRALALLGTGVTAEAVPGALSWACTFDEKPDLAKLARRARPKAGQKAKVDPALLADLTSTDAAVASAAMLRLDRAGFDELLKFGRASGNGIDTTHPLLEKLPHRVSLLWALVLHAPEDLPRAVALRDRTVKWHPREHYTGLWPIDAALLTRFTRAWAALELEGVRLLRVGALAPSRCQSLTLANGELDAPEALADLTSLTRLSLTGVATRGLALPPSLTSLWIADAPDLESLVGLAGPAVRNLDLRGGPASCLASLDGITGFPAIENVYLRTFPRLGSLEPMLALRPLSDLWISGCDAVQDLWGVPPAKRLAIESCGGLSSLSGLRPSTATCRIDLRACDGLTSLDGAAAWAGLEELEATGCRALTDVRALDGHPTLRGLDVRRCTSLATLPLAGCDTLRAVLVSGTAIDVASVPQAIRWACSTEPYGRLDKLVLRIPPTPAPVVKADKDLLLPILRLLRASDVEAVDQGLELAAALDDPALWDTLLEGSELEASSRNRSHTRLVSSRFSGTFAPYVLLALVDLAPASCARAAALRVGLTSFTTYGTRDEDGRRPFDPRRLGAFPNLENVALDRVGPFVKRGEASPLPALQRVYLQELNGLTDLWWLAEAPQLAEVELWETPVRSLAGLEGAPRLRSLKCRRNPLRDLAPLLTMPALKSVSLSYINLDTPDPVVAALLARGVSVSRS